MTEPTTSHDYLSTGCLHGMHAYCQSDTGAAGTKTPAQCKFCAAPCRCWCHSTCPHVVPYLTGENCESCGATPEQMVPNPAEFRQELAESRRQAMVRRARDGRIERRQEEAS